jgi:hypothetical protein
MFSMENIFLKNDFPENIFRWKTFYFLKQTADVYIAGDPYLRHFVKFRVLMLHKNAANPIYIESGMEYYSCF